MYRFQKFARKHKPALATTAAIAVCLLLGTTVSAWQAVRATTAEAQAVTNATAAEQKEQEAIKQRDEVKALADKLASKEQQLQRTLYAAHMNLAHNAFEAGAPARLQELLAQHRPQPGEADVRGFEWHYLNRLCPPDLLVLKGHTGGIDIVAYSPDGKQIATGSRDLSVKLWDAQTGKELYSLNGAVASLAFSPDSKRIATSGRGKSVKIWDSKTGQELRTIEIALKSQRQVAPHIAFSPDGKYLAAGTSDGEIRMLDAESFEELRTMAAHSSAIKEIIFSPDGKRLASTTWDKVLKIHDVQTGETVYTLEGHSVAFGPDGKLLVSGSRGSPDSRGVTVKLWDAQTGKELYTLQHHAPGGSSVALSPDGKSIASGAADGSVTVWDAGTGVELYTLRGHAALVTNVAFSPDGKRLASASLDNTVKVREAKAIPESRKIQATGITNLVFGPDGKRLASVGFPSAEQIKIWDAQTGETLLTIATGSHRADGQPFDSVSFSGDGRRVAIAPDLRLLRNPESAEASVWDLQTGKKVGTIPLKHKSRSIRFNVILSSNGERLAAATSIPGIPGGPRRGSIADGINIWDVQTGQELRTIPAAGGPAVFMPDGQRLAGIASDNSVKIWDVHTGTEVRSFSGPTGCLTFSPDGKLLAGSTEVATVAKVWDAQTGNELLTLRGHNGIINRLAFSPDGKRLVSTARDGALRIWDTETGQELLTLKGNFAVANGIAFAPDGHRLAAGGPNGTVLIYDATPLPEKP